MKNDPDLIVIVGSTAVGKTSIGIGVASALNGEIISADARQIYKGMNIGTAKPSTEELNKIPHHMIDIVEPGEYFSAGEFGIMGGEVIRDIISRGKLPVIVGGSGLYIRALIDGLFEGDSRSEEVRKTISEEVKRDGLDKVYLKLKEIDPEYAGSISSNDEIRISRALEVFEITGKTLTETFASQSDTSMYNSAIFGLRSKRSRIIESIELRVDKMLEDGLVEEVKGLIQAGYREDLQKLPTIGYSEVINYLEGSIDEDEMIRKIKTNSRRYAKRQMTWFKTDERIRWIDIDKNEDPAEEIMDQWKKISAII